MFSSLMYPPLYTVDVLQFYYSYVMSNIISKSAHLPAKNSGLAYNTNNPPTQHSCHESNDLDKDNLKHCNSELTLTRWKKNQYDIFNDIKKKNIAIKCIMCVFVFLHLLYLCELFRCQDKSKSNRNLFI